jgi:hypothetical protein
MEFKTDIIELNTIESTFTHQEKIEEENERKERELNKLSKLYVDILG